jgi:hypothetical protein
MKSLAKLARQRRATTGVYRLARLRNVFRMADLLDR